jgi:hypothetical protein
VVEGLQTASVGEGLNDRRPRWGRGVQMLWGPTPLSRARDAVRDQTRIVNRVKATLVRFGIRNFKVKLRHAAAGLEKL